MVSDGRFREDLWYRLNVFPIVIPPLRARKMDIPALVNHFLEIKSKQMGLPSPPALSPGAIDLLTGYHWPGNVRELENAVERGLILSRGRPLTFDELCGGGHSYPEEILPDDPRNFPRLDQAMAGHIRRALHLAGGRVEGERGAATILGLKPSTLRNRMKKLDIPYGRGGKK